MPARFSNSSLHMKKIQDFLEQLGLNKVEAEIYYGLLNHGPSTVKHLAEHTGLNRVTTHFQINNLINKGLVIQIKKDARRQIVAEPPERLAYLIEQKEKGIKQLRDDFPDFIKSIQPAIPVSNTKDEEVEVKFYKGKQGCQLIYEDVLQAKELRTYVNSKEIASYFPDNANLFINNHNKRSDMFIWEIMNKSTIFDSKSYANSMVKGRYFVKFIPPSLDLSVIDYMIYDGKVAIVNIKESPTGMIIINSDYYENAKAIFNFVWKMLPD